MIFEQEGYSNLTNVTQILEVANIFTGGILGFGIWFLLSIGTFFLLSRYDFKHGIISATFVALITSLLLTFLGLLDGEFVIISISLFTIAIVASILIKGSPGGI